MGIMSVRKNLFHKIGFWMYRNLHYLEGSFFLKLGDKLEKKEKKNWRIDLKIKRIGWGIVINHKYGKVVWHDGNHTIIVMRVKYIKWPDESFWSQRGWFFIRTGKRITKGVKK